MSWSWEYFCPPWADGLSHERLLHVLYNFPSYRNPYCGGKKHKNSGKNPSQVSEQHWRNSFSRRLLQALNCLPAVIDSIPMPALTTCSLQLREMEKHRYSLWSTRLDFLPLLHMAIFFLLSLWQSCAILQLLTAMGILFHLGANQAQTPALLLIYIYGPAALPLLWWGLYSSGRQGVADDTVACVVVVAFHN